MTNKELAVQLYIATLQANATVASNPNFKEKISIPTIDSVVASVAEYTKKLSAIEDQK